MNITRRAKRRLSLLLIIGLALGVLVTGGWFLRQQLKDSRAESARIDGLAAASRGAWKEALPNLSIASARYKDDLECLLMLAEARSRVPQPNSTHITSAQGLYRRCLDLAVRVDDEDSRLAALHGLSRLYLATGSVGLLSNSAARIIEITPGDQMAMKYLLVVQEVRGKLLPDTEECLALEAPTDVEWLDCLRGNDDDSALRWLLEQIVLDPSDISLRQDLLALLRNGGWSELRLELSGDQQPLVTVVQAWIDNQASGYSRRRNPIPRFPIR